MTDDRPPVLFVLSDALAEMGAHREEALDALLSTEIQRLTFLIKRMGLLQRVVTDVVGQLERRASEVAQDARDPWLGEEEFDEEEL